ncbi:unnamed protein product [Clonostachys solani]|uniref:Uncharacterized protein n=1 Tax=Clonostachys solani TaxID=160281 RepID=A0A9N9ZGR4_9HYPO|nr:unnamed protein product [Clonostachys solani]
MAVYLEELFLRRQDHLPRPYFESMSLIATLVVMNIYKSQCSPRLTQKDSSQASNYLKVFVPPLILPFQTFNFAKMKFIAATILIAATTVVAQYDPCRSPLFAVPLCCKTDVLGVLGLNCEAPIRAPLNAAGFQATCALANARDSKCCLAHLLDQAVLCIPPSP